MVEYTDLEEMIEHADVGDSIKITCNRKSFNGSEYDIGTIEEKDGYYNVLFEDGYGDEYWENTSLEDLISSYCEAWEEDGKISLIKKNSNKPNDPQEIYEFIARTLKREYGDNVRYGYPDGASENANKLGCSAGIAINCEVQPNGADVYVKVGYSY